MTSRTLKALASIAAAATFAGAPAIAQGAAPPAQAQQQITPLKNAEITPFLTANSKVNVIADQMNAELQAAETQDEAAEIQQGAETQMIAAIESEGLTPLRFTQIVQLARTDQATNQKLVAAMEG